MSDHPSSRQFRTALRQELPRWRAEGIVDAQAEVLLARRYGLADRDATGFAVAALYLLAACLVGGGVVSLVAWHWDDMSRWSRLALLGTALVAAHVTGYRMWQATGRQPRLGHALSFLGTIIFGASIGLVAQIFQVSGPWYGAFGAWALGAFAAGSILPSLPSLCLAAFLAMFVWGPGFIPDHAELGAVLAWMIGGTSLALAFRFRSRVLFLVSIAGLAVMLAVAASYEPGSHPWTSLRAPLATLLAVSAASCAFAVWSAAGVSLALAPASAWVGRIAFYLLGYVVSFEQSAKAIVEHSEGWTRGWLSCALPAATAAVGLLATARPAPSAVPPLRATAAVAVAFLSLFAIAGSANDHPLYLAVLSNVALLAIAGVWIAHGLRSRLRAPFWEGLIVVSVLGVSRFFEIERLLWLKGAGFIACGVAVVVAGMAFERRLQAREPRHA